MSADALRLKRLTRFEKVKMSSGHTESSHPGLNDVSVPDLDGPDEYHVYMGCCDTDEPAVKVKTILSELGYTCYQDDSQLARSENIESGIDKCRNILFLVSPSYMKSSWYAFETQQAVEKAEVRGIGSLMVVLCGVDESQISARLRGFKTIEYSDDATWKEKLHISLADEPLPPLPYLTKDNFGAALAYSYFYGYLKFVLPALSERIHNSGMQDDSDGSRIMSHKMFIIMPESCYAPINLHELDENLKSGSWIPFKASRAGITARDYKSPVYEFTDVNTGQVYRLVIEIATPLATLLDMYNDKVSGLTVAERTMEVRRFYFLVKALLSHDKYRHLGLQNKAAIVYYKDMKSNHEHFGELLLRRLKHEIAKELEDEQVEGR